MKRHFLHLFAALMALVLPTLAMASLDSPEDGIWSDESKPGSGFVIELQDSTMAVAAFAYTAQGPATWLLATGNYNTSTRTFNSSAVTLQNGQCLGCTHRVPTPVGQATTIEVRFSSLVAGTVLINGQPAYNIRKSYYAFGTLDDVVLGGWAAAYYSIGGGLSGHALRMESKITLNDGSPGTRGRIDLETRPAVGTFSAGTGKYLVLVDSSTSFYVTYIFDAKKDFWFGKGYLYLKTGSISDALPKDHYAARVLRRPSLGVVKKDASDPDPREALHWDEYNASKSELAVSEELSADLLDMEAEARAYMESLQ